MLLSSCIRSQGAAEVADAEHSYKVLFKEVKKIAKVANMALLDEVAKVAEMRRR